jgi:hypothetical protein
MKLGTKSIETTETREEIREKKFSSFYAWLFALGVLRSLCAAVLKPISYF